ncbi:MAG: hypothetical protein GF308_13670 [Candidatus Heimdallarchaeota archaeon]|nr:hypothetical protein [Candidatus Heimdallarchaeota archaeon]
MPLEKRYLGNNILYAFPSFKGLELEDVPGLVKKIVSLNLRPDRDIALLDKNSRWEAEICSDAGDGHFIFQKNLTKCCQVHVHSHPPREKLYLPSLWDLVSINKGGFGEYLGILTLPEKGEIKGTVFICKSDIYEPIFYKSNPSDGTVFSYPKGGEIKEVVVYVRLG